ncbi:MAG: hypothetical protein ACREQ5_31980, partial [Candidatus Dormibacteria bacterium]
MREHCMAPLGRATMRGRQIPLLAVFVALGVAACGGSSNTTPAAEATRTVTETPAATATPASTPAAVTFTQSIAVGKALFPQVSGKYLECDATPDAILACPFDARLRAQVEAYAANKQRLCPQGCGGALLLLRQQCGGFTSETVNTPQNESIGIVMLTGNSCLGNVSEIMYVQVVIENGVPLADDVMCNVGDPKYGMYNANTGATGGNPCA